MAEARSFIIYTDHRPITYAFQKKNTGSSLRQIRHLDFISQFTNDIRHTTESENVVAELFPISRPWRPRLTSRLWQQELERFRTGNTGLQLKLVRIPGCDVSVLCDVSTRTARPYVTESFRRAAFESIHRLSHPGVKATVKLVTQRYVWPSVKADCRESARNCLECQRSKIPRHVFSPGGTFSPPLARFEHVHLDIVIMTLSEGCCYCLTMVDPLARSRTN